MQDERLIGYHQERHDGQGKDSSLLARNVTKAITSLDHYIDVHKSSVETDQTLRPKQLTVFEDLRTTLASGQSEGYIKLPTGTGKTVLFVEFAEAINLRTLAVVPTKLLVEQTEDKFDEFAEGLETGKIYTYAKEYGRPVTITTYNSLLTGIDNGTINPEDFDLLILDEAHRSLSDKRKDAVRKFTHAIKIGLSATPTYSVIKNLKNLLNNEIHSMTIKEAVEAGLLSPFSVYLAKTDIDISHVSVAANGEYNEGQLE